MESSTRPIFEASISIEREREREREAVEETRILAGIIYHAARDSESAVTDREEEIFRKAA